MHLDLNLISIGQDDNKEVDYIDAESIGKERYGQGLNYLIRPDGYIVGIFREVNINTIKKCML